MGLPFSRVGFAVSIPRGIPEGMLHSSPHRATRHRPGRTAWPETKDVFELFLQPMPSHLRAKACVSRRYWQNRGLSPNRWMF